jgi:hypothetical protein
VDWSAITTIKRMVPGSEVPDKANRIAYLARDNTASMLIRIACALFPSAQHRLFLDRAKALAWLLEPAKKDPTVPSA